MKAFKSLSSDWYEFQLRIFTKKVTVAKETGFNILSKKKESFKWYEEKQESRQGGGTEWDIKMLSFQARHIREIKLLNEMSFR